MARLLERATRRRREEDAVGCCEGDDGYEDAEQADGDVLACVAKASRKRMAGLHRSVGLQWLVVVS